MDEKQDTIRDDHANEGDHKVNFLDYVSILVKWRKFIAINFVVVTLGAVIISLLLPKWYKATASILPPKDQGLFSSLGVAGSVLKGLAPNQRIGGLGQKTGTYNFLAILKSRSAMEAVVRKFDLMNEYDVSDSSMEKALEELQDNVSFEVQDDDNITVEVLDKSPQRVAEIANYFVEQLNTISNQLGTREARNNREFIEKRIGESKDELRRTEDALKAYQEKSGVMVAPEQNSSSISAIAEMYGMKAKKEVELAILRRTVTGENAMIRQLEVELSELNKKLGTFPQVGLESFRLYRDAAIQQKVVEYLIPLYEQAKIDEQKDTPVILVLDKAVPPERKFKPKRSIIVISSGLSALLLSLVAAFLVERVHQFRHIDPSRFQMISRLFHWRSEITER
ncbi:MAG: hypothetical protein HYR76_12440 [Ignavibacteria bacterium]|nr:hypothetical protein [Ignavibacteria bacterium]MBI3766129.1 hypothetical protein [Ignavibacteriales bacterium]